MYIFKAEVKKPPEGGLCKTERDLFMPVERSYTHI